MVGHMIPPIATTSEQSQLRLTRKMTGVQIRQCRWDLRQRPMIQEWMETSGSGQEWLHAPSSSGYWRASLRVRREKYFSSAAGDASEASTAANALGSIHETDGDAVRAWSDKPALQVVTPHTYHGPQS